MRGVFLSSMMQPLDGHALCGLAVAGSVQPKMAFCLYSQGKIVHGCEAGGAKPLA